MAPFIVAGDRDQENRPLARLVLLNTNIVVKIRQKPLCRLERNHLCIATI
jgi:hypothetical protein